MTYSANFEEKLQKFAVKLKIYGAFHPHSHAPFVKSGVEDLWTEAKLSFVQFSFFHVFFNIIDCS